MPDLTPVHFFSHGSTMMLGEESDAATYWKQCGDDALAHGIKGVIMMVSSSKKKTTKGKLTERQLTTAPRAPTGTPTATASKSP